MRGLNVETRENNNSKVTGKQAKTTWRTVWLSTVQGAWASRPARNTSSSVLFSPTEFLPWNRHTANAARDSAAHDHAGGLEA